MHIVIINRWPRFDQEAGRWDNELTKYEEFINHKTNKVSYVVDRLGVDGVLIEREQVAGFEQIDDVNQEVQLEAACRSIIAQHGPIDILIALSEFTLEIAARVRETLSIPGPKLEEVNRYRDKVCMKQHISQAGLRAPEFVSADQEDAYQLACRWSFPLILKPRCGAASAGVIKVESAQALQSELAKISLKDYQIEEFIEGDIYHIDGYVDTHGKVVFQVVSKYINDCLSFSEGAPLASFVIADSEIKDTIEKFSIQCCEVLALTSTPFHLEVFWHNDEPVFLEIGARVGGSEVPHLINKIFGVNLYEFWLKEQSGEELPGLHSRQTDFGGWLVFPKPEDVAHKVKKSISLKANNSAIWRELIPADGQLLQPGGAYDALHKGRFIFVTKSAQETESEIHYAIENFQCELEKII